MQGMLHAPQCCGSDESTAHVEPHRTWPGLHMIAPVHIEAVQLCPGAHVRPQAPQLSRSLASSTHVPLQLVCVPVHITVEGTHAPAVHICPIAQTVPHAPQLFVSLCVFTQALPQRTSPALQSGSAHTPIAHVCPPEHALPHSPQ